MLERGKEDGLTAETIVTIFVASFAPAIVLLGYYALKDRYRPEPLRLLLGVFAAGLVAAPVALLAFQLLAHEAFYEMLSRIDRANDDVKLAYALFAIGPVEELAKFVAVWVTVYRFRVLEEPVDGMVYAAAAALGFATYENWLAMITMGEVMWARGITLPFNHVLFSSFWGYAIGIEYCAMRSGRSRSALVVAGLVLSFVYHALYDYILLSDTLPDLLVLPLVLLLWIWVQLALGRLLARSPFRPF